MARRHVERTIRVLNSRTLSIASQITVAHWLWDNGYGPDSDGVKRSEIEDEIGHLLDHSVRTSLDHLEDVHLVEARVERDSPYVIAEWHPDTFIMGQVDEAASEGIEALIRDINERETVEDGTLVAADGGEEPLRHLVAEQFDLVPSAVEDHLRDGDPVERLNRAVEAIEESDDHNVGDGYGEIVFRNPAYKYRITEAGQQLYEL